MTDINSIGKVQDEKIVKSIHQSKSALFYNKTKRLTVINNESSNQILLNDDA